MTSIEISLRNKGISLPTAQFKYLVESIFFLLRFRISFGVTLPGKTNFPPLDKSKSKKHFHLDLQLFERYFKRVHEMFKVPLSTLLAICYHFSPLYFVALGIRQELKKKDRLSLSTLLSTTLLTT